MMENQANGRAAIEKRSGVLRKVLTVVVVVAALFFTVQSVMLIYSAMLPGERFTAEQGLSHWRFSAKITDTFSLVAQVPHSILQPLSPERFDAKAAYFVYLVSRLLFMAGAFLYGTVQIRSVVSDMAAGQSPFTLRNASRLRMTGYVTIGYFVLADLTAALLYWLLVTGIFSIGVTVSLVGVGSGIGLLLLAEVFKYGAFLQEESDTTL